MRDTRSHEELRQRVLTVAPYGTNVVGAVTGMDTAGTINKLRDCAARLDASDCRRMLDPQKIGILSVSLYGHVPKAAQKLCHRRLVPLDQQAAVHDAGHRHAQQTLLLRVLPPNLPQIGEVRKGGLEGSKDRCQTYLACQILSRIVLPADNLRQVTELEWPQDNLGLPSDNAIEG